MNPKMLAQIMDQKHPLLVGRALGFFNSTTVVLAPRNTKRYAIAFECPVFDPTLLANLSVQVKDLLDPTQLMRFRIFAAQNTGATGGPVAVYNPRILTVEQYGSLIWGEWTIFSNPNTDALFVSEVLYSPQETGEYPWTK